MESEKAPAGSDGKSGGENPIRAVNRLLRLGGQLLVAGRFDEAEGAFAECVRINPDETRAYFGLAVCALHRKDDARAEPLLRRSVGQPKVTADALFHLGRIAEGRKEWESAARFFQGALALNPGHKHARDALSKLTNGRPPTGKMSGPGKGKPRLRLADLLKGGAGKTGLGGTAVATPPVPEKKPDPPGRGSPAIPESFVDILARQNNPNAQAILRLILDTRVNRRAMLSAHVGRLVRNVALFAALVVGVPVVLGVVVPEVLRGLLSRPGGPPPPPPPPVVPPAFSKAAGLRPDGGPIVLPNPPRPGERPTIPGASGGGQAAPTLVNEQIPPDMRPPPRESFTPRNGLDLIPAVLAVGCPAVLLLTVLAVKAKRYVLEDGAASVRTGFLVGTTRTLDLTRVANVTVRKGWLNLLTGGGEIILRSGRDVLRLRGIARGRRFDELARNLQLLTTLLRATPYWKPPIG